MDATGVEMLFLERSEQGKYTKADIFDHPTAFSTSELTIASDPLEALGASLNKYGSVELGYMSSLLPEMEESDIISALEGRIYYNPEIEGYEVADKFISGNVVEKAERIQFLALRPSQPRRSPTEFGSPHSRQTHSYSLCRIGLQPW